MGLFTGLTSFYHRLQYRTRILELEAIVRKQDAEYRSLSTLYSDITNECNEWSRIAGDRKIKVTELHVLAESHKEEISGLRAENGRLADENVRLVDKNNTLQSEIDALYAGVRRIEIVCRDIFLISCVESHYEQTIGPVLSRRCLRNPGYIAGDDGSGST